MKKRKKQIANVEFGHEIFDINGSKLYEVMTDEKKQMKNNKKKSK